MCGSVTRASRFLIDWLTCFAAHDGQLAMSSLLGPAGAEVSGSTPRLTWVAGMALLPGAGLDRGVQAPAALRVAVTTGLFGMSAQAISK
jgi:hypothetical protein